MDKYIDSYIDTHIDISIHVCIDSYRESEISRYTDKCICR